jgi:phosphosulfolactate synthase
LPFNRAVISRIELNNDGETWEGEITVDKLRILKDVEKLLDNDSRRAKKPRKIGITMVIVEDVANYGPNFIAPFQELIDRIKLLDFLWHHDMSVIEKAVSAYREMDIDVAPGGSHFEIAKAQGRLKEYLYLLRDLGINEVEVENHAGISTIEEMKDEVKFFKDQGFQVVGEIGRKWWWKDPTRISRDLVSVEKTVDQANQLIEAGADYVYWEGMIVRSLIGPQLENTKGQKQLIDVANQVDPDKMLFELWDARFQPNRPLFAWLVKQFGPNVNLANIMPWEVKILEWIRHGIFYEMDHPYMKWARDKTQGSSWWKIDAPDYEVDLQRGYALKNSF